MNIPTLTTERLIMRGWRESDLANFAKFQMDKQAAHFVRPSETVAEAWRLMAYFAGHFQLRGFGNWSLERKDTGEHIGRCGPYYPMEWPEPEIGWCIYSEHQRKGYAAEAASASLDYAYKTLGWKTAISLIANDNAPSIALATKLGAMHEGPFVFRDMPCTIYRHLSPQNLNMH